MYRSRWVTTFIDQLMDGAEETPTLEFKGAMVWNAGSIAKDILAMANEQDGGRIVFGIEDQTLQRTGLTEQQLSTYIPDEMKDQMARYADPYVRFSVSVQSDAEGKKYVVLDVSSFDEFPVICCRDGPDVQRGTIYSRSKTERPRSVRVSNSSDMRDLIEIAVARRMQRLRKLGFDVVDAVEGRLDSELGGL